ncbi:hypothetical protein QFC19_001527 [Naganishia cerealis]|uniref:Uncharacterized protein n=1 Tax=Naganishia cerealis TaxID=610337 RepID=A0ACC2WGW2_9TREE|nr:hypothetical protein QFC19_001527 [Naganishia cerealis]
MSQRLSTADSVSSQYSSDERQVVEEACKTPVAAEFRDVSSHVDPPLREEVPTKGFVRLNGARMARTLDSDTDRAAMPVPDQGSSGLSHTSKTLPGARNVDALTDQIRNTHIGQTLGPVVPTHPIGAGPGTLWDSSTYHPGPTSQMIPSLPTLTTVSSAPVLLRDMSFSRKSMVGEMGEYEHEYENEDQEAPSLSPSRSSLRKGKSSEDLSPQRLERPPLTNRNSRMHYTRRPAPPPPVPPIPALYLSAEGKDRVAGSQRIGERVVASEGERQLSALITRKSGDAEQALTSHRNALSPPSTLVEARRPSYSHLTPEERRAKVAEDYLTKGIAAHNESTGLHDLGESAYYFRKAAEGGLALRHGWGVAQDEKAAFNWFGKACESTMLANDRQGDDGADLLAKKNKSKLTLAAESGDKDAQEQLGLILSQGKPGVKKDM